MESHVNNTLPKLFGNLKNDITMLAIVFSVAFSCRMMLVMRAKNKALVGHTPNDFLFFLILYLFIGFVYTKSNVRNTILFFSKKKIQFFLMIKVNIFWLLFIYFKISFWFFMF